MRKALGFLAWTSLAAAGLWATLPGGTTRPVSADQPTTTNGGSALSRMNPFSRSKTKSNETNYRQSAEKLMKDAQALALRGDLMGARKLLERAQSFPVDWGPEERTPEKFIAQLDARMTAQNPETAIAGRSNAKPGQAGAASTRSPIQQVNNEQSDDPTAAGKPRTAGLTNAQKLAMAKSLIQAARTDLTNGDIASAREKAEQAAGIDVAYSPFDVRPEQILAEISRLERDEENAAAATSIARTPKSAAKKPVASLDEEPPFSDSPADMQEPASTAEVAPAANDKQLAQQLLKQAQSAIDSGNVEQARSLALEAADLDVAYSLFELQPQHVLAQVDRVSNNLTIAKGGSKAKSATPWSKELPFDENEPPFSKTASDDIPVAKTAVEEIEAQTRQSAARIAAADKAIANKAKEAEDQATAKVRQQAMTALQQARQDMQAGRIEAARQKAIAAQKLNATFGLWDERPEALLEEIDQLANASKPTPSKPSVSNDNKARAMALLKSARADLAAGRLDDAQDKVNQASEMDVAYGVLEDFPEQVQAAIDRAKSPQTSRKTVAKSLPPTDEPEEVTKPAPQTESPSIAKSNPSNQFKSTKPSTQPLRNIPANSNLAADDLKDVTKPESTLRNLPAKSPTDESIKPAPQTVRNSATKTIPSVDEPEEQAQPAPQTARSLPSQPLPTTTPAAFAEEDTEPANVAVIHPEGPSAEQLFREGQNHLQRGDKAAAYQAFVRAYQSGQRLDARRSQQLQDYLRELNPRRGKPIQMVSAEEGSADGSAEPRALDPQRPIDIASDRQKVQLDRLRSEVLNAVSRADRVREKDPAKAIEILDQAMANVETSPLDKPIKANLATTLRKTRAEIEGFQKQMEPNLIQAKANDEVKESINRRRINTVRVEREYATLVKEFNELMDQRQFAEAEVKAKQAQELDPDNPVSEVMIWKSLTARRNYDITQLKDAKERGFIDALFSAEESAIPFDDRKPIRYSKDWEELTKRRDGKYHTDTRIRSPEEQRIEKSLTRPITLNFENVPLKQVINHIGTWADINVVVDRTGLEDEQLSDTTPVSINLDSIPLKDALHLLLHPLNLGYTINHSVLNITSEQRLQGQAVLATYSVADLVVPIQPGQPNLNVFGNTAAVGNSVGGQMSVPSTGGLQGGQFQVGQPGTTMGSPVSNPWLTNGNQNWQVNGGAAHDFRALIDLIVSTCEPSSWEEVGGGGHIKGNETTLSLVIRQTQKVHDEIRDLLEQLRRLQDLQVTIEVRFVSVSDNFFERIGVDFDFDLQDSLGGPNLFSGGGQQGQAGQGGQGGQGGQQGQQGGLIPIPPFGTILPSQQQGQQQQGQQQQGQQGQQAQQGQGGGPNFFAPQPNREFTDRDNGYNGGQVIGLGSSESFTEDLDIAFRQGSFGIGVPDFGRFDANAGVNIGFAILSDIETFFFINAAQGDRRNNIMSAPKVTLFNGQTGTVFDGAQRPFVTQLIPVVGAFAVGYQPIITPVFEGVGMSVQAVISADRRYVRLAVTPQFSVIREVQAFTFVSAGGQAQQGQAGQQGQQGQGGGGFGGQGGGGQQGFGGIGGGVGVGYEGLYNHGVFGQAMGDRADVAIAAQTGFGGIGGIGGQGGGGFGGQGGGGFGGQGGQQGQGGFQAAGAGEVTVQQPIVASTTVLTVVAVPDGGTVLLGGVKRLSESRNMAGVPILNKIPYISRLFKNTGVGRETQSLMLMVTPRIVILEEEESLLGIPN